MEGAGYNQSPISLRQGKLTTHTEELYPKNPYLQDLLSAEVRVPGLRKQVRQKKGPWSLGKYIRKDSIGLALCRE